jgi:hypothetical protein
MSGSVRLRHGLIATAICQKLSLHADPAHGNVVLPKSIFSQAPNDLLCVGGIFVAWVLHRRPGAAGSATGGNIRF